MKPFAPIMPFNRTRSDVKINIRFCASLTRLLLATSAFALASCASDGPLTRTVVKAPQKATADAVHIKVVDVTDATIQQLATMQRKASFLDQLGDGVPRNVIVGSGDTLDVAIWEAPPAALFGLLNSGGGASEAVGSGGMISRSPAIPEQMVDSDGQISIPFVGKVDVAGLTPQQISVAIERRLQGKAHLPQVVVRRIENSTANVTVVGDVSKSGRIPLTPKGERLLDALAGAGGTKEPINKLVVQLTRGGKVTTMPLDTVIRDPRQNIRLAPDDVVTLLFQPYSFTALGAVNKSSEVPFEATGMSLAQALGRIGGLDDNRSDAKGVFVFRFENYQNGLVDEHANDGSNPTRGIPVIYRFDLKNPASLFFLQRFAMQDHDVVFVSNSPITDFQKFLGLISQVTFSLIGIAGV
jgi:polysaccharide biosynthesis/export protein